MVSVSALIGGGFALTGLTVIYIGGHVVDDHYVTGLGAALLAVGFLLLGSTACPACQTTGVIG